MPMRGMQRGGAGRAGLRRGLRQQMGRGGAAGQAGGMRQALAGAMGRPAGPGAAMTAARGAMPGAMQRPAVAPGVGGMESALAGRAAGAWRMVGVDPDGIDLLQCTIAARLDFRQHVCTPGQARAQFVSLVQQARARRQARA